MKYLWVKQKIENYDKWLAIFKSHEKAQHEAGLRDCQLFCDENDPNTVICFFKVTDEEKAKEFTTSPQAEQGKDDSGVVGEPEVFWLEEL